MMSKKDITNDILTSLEGTVAEKYINQIDDLLESLITDQDITDQEEFLLFNYLMISMNDFFVD